MLMTVPLARYSLQVSALPRQATTRHDPPHARTTHRRTPEARSRPVLTRRGRGREVELFCAPINCCFGGCAPEFGRFREQVTEPPGHLIGSVAKWLCCPLREATSAALPYTRRAGFWAVAGSTRPVEPRSTQPQFLLFFPSPKIWN